MTEPRETDTDTSDDDFQLSKQDVEAIDKAIDEGDGAALDTLAELAAALGNDPSFAATIAGEIANRVRYDAAQALSAPQQAQARLGRT